MAEAAENPEKIEALMVDEVEDDDEGELSWSSDSEIGDALHYLDSKEDEAVDGGFILNSRRPNAHGGVHSRHNTSALQPLSNRNQRFTHHIRTSPLEEWEGRNVSMSNSVTTAIRGSVRDMAIGKSRTTDKADRASVEQGDDDKREDVILPRDETKGGMEFGCNGLVEFWPVEHPSEPSDEDHPVKCPMPDSSSLLHVSSKLGIANFANGFGLSLQL